jgi:hypothetical protein
MESTLPSLKPMTEEGTVPQKKDAPAKEEEAPAGGSIPAKSA